MTVEELILKRKNLAEDRDHLQKEIVELWEQIKSTFFAEIRNFGIFKERWKYAEDLSAYSTSRITLFLQNYGLAVKVCDLAKKYDIRTTRLDLNDGVTICFWGESVQLIFDTKTDISKFIKEYNITVDCSGIDENINNLNKIKNQLR